MAPLASDPHFQNSRHRTNAVGVVASCSNCHIPSTSWFTETYTHAVMGLKDLIAGDNGDFSKAAWKARRIELAHAVRREMRNRDSVTCRGCHRVDAIKSGSEPRVLGTRSCVKKTSPVSSAISTSPTLRFLGHELGDLSEGNIRRDCDAAQIF